MLTVELCCNIRDFFLSLWIGLCDKHDVNGYPTIRFYNYGNFVVEYDGARETEDFIMFMEDPPKPLPPVESTTESQKRQEL